MADPSLTDTDKGFARFFRGMKEAARTPHQVKVGVLAGGPPRAEGGPTNVELAAIHEFGSPSQGIPERSFLRRTADANAQKYLKLLERAAGQIARGKLSTDDALNLVGARAAADVRGTITKGSGVAPPLKPATIARKGSSRPLVDTGQLVGSITWALVKAEGGQ